ncbi:hypothetical protein DW049_18925 [Ruminococcus sp. AF41-9]|nr:hypothetical protein DW049_18925 [Ruminococcus sp. AF41-9]
MKASRITCFFIEKCVCKRESPSRFPCFRGMEGGRGFSLCHESNLPQVEKPSGRILSCSEE